MTTPCCHVITLLCRLMTEADGVFCLMDDVVDELYRTAAYRRMNRNDLRCTLYPVQCKVHSVQCTVYSVHCTLYRVNCTVYMELSVCVVQCTLYNV